MVRLHLFLKPFKSLAMRFAKKPCGAGCHSLNRCLVEALIGFSARVGSPVEMTN